MKLATFFLLSFTNLLVASSSMDNMPKEKNHITGYAEVEVDPERVQLYGITTEKVIIRDLIKTIRTVGIVEVDERRIAHVQTKFKGWIEELFVNFTQIPVLLGQPLFTVYSPELLTAQEEYLLALRDVQHPVRGRFGQELQQSNRDLLEAAQRRLELWDVPAEAIERLQETLIASKTLTIDSPVEGIVLNKNAFIGMNVEPGMNIFTIADLSHVWVMADIYEQDISWLKLGQQAVISLPTFPGKTLKGTVSFVNYVVEPSTRTMKVRFDFDNPNYQLKPGMYTTVETKINMGLALAVPETAIIDTGERKIVFVVIGKGRFNPIDVKLGFKAGPYYQVLSGLTLNEEVLTSAQFLMDSESRLKAAGGGMHGMEEMGNKKKP
jgi:Cu(I)/Ag(I) efflux system membrane fusion protein